MTRNGLFRLALLLTLFSFTLAAGTLDLLSLANNPVLGDVNTDVPVYTDAIDNVHAAPAWSKQILVGGMDNYNNPSPSGAVVATNLAFTTNPTVLSTPDPLWASQLGLTVADLNAMLIDTLIGVANGSAISWTVNVAAGTNIDLMTNFVANDISAFDDFAFFSVVGGPGVKYTQLLNRIDLTTYPATGVGDNASSGFARLQYLFAAGGTYTVGFGVMNVGPYAVDATGLPPIAPAVATNFDWDPLSATYLPEALGGDSALLIANVPEPSTWLFAGPAVLLAGLLRRRRKAS